MHRRLQGVILVLVVVGAGITLLRMGASWPGDPESQERRSEQAALPGGTRVTIDWEDVPVPEFLDRLREMTGVVVTLAPGVAESCETAGMLVTLPVQDLTLDRVLELLAESCGLKLVRERGRYRLNGDCLVHDPRLGVFDVHAYMWEQLGPLSPPPPNEDVLLASLRDRLAALSVTRGSPVTLDQEGGALLVRGSEEQLEWFNDTLHELNPRRSLAVPVHHDETFPPGMVHLDVPEELVAGQTIEARVLIETGERTLARYRISVVWDPQVLEVRPTRDTCHAHEVYRGVIDLFKSEGEFLPDDRAHGTLHVATLRISAPRESTADRTTLHSRPPRPLPVVGFHADDQPDAAEIERDLDDLAIPGISVLTHDGALEVLPRTAFRPATIRITRP